MKYDPFSRRMFLIGAGKTALALPLLPSLMPRFAWAQAPRPVRYVQIFNPYSPDHQQFFDRLQYAPNKTKFASHVQHLLLKNYSQANISRMIGASFNPLRDKINLVCGMDVQVVNGNHNYCFASCAGGYELGIDNDEAPPEHGQESVDVLISKSPKVYGPEVPQGRRHVFMNPLTSDDYSNNRTFSWKKTTSGLQMVRPTKATSALYDLFSSGFGAMSAPPAQPTDLSLVEGVYSDYRSTRDSAKISAEDKQRLTQYMELINDIQNSLKSQAAAPPACTAPSRVAEGSPDATVSNQFKILAAALACDMTRVASVTLGMSEGPGTRHGEHHMVYQGPPDFVSDLAKNGQRVAEFLSLINSISDGNGTLLDNSLVYWNSQYACAQIEDQYSRETFPVMLAGSAGGQMRTGYFVDYRHETSFVKENQGFKLGIPINNLMVTIMNCMGLSSSDYEAAPGRGYGSYFDKYKGDARRPNIDSWMTTAGRRTPLPFLYMGPNRG